MTTREEIKGWIERGQTQGAAYMIVACDTFDWGDYPVFVAPGDDLKTSVSQYDGPNMQKVMEVYDLNGDIEAQLKLRRARADLTIAR